MACSTDSPRPAATAPASCSVTDSASRAAASRAGPVNPDSVSWSGADLYSCRLRALEADAELFQRVVQEHLLDGDAGEPEGAGRLQVDPVEAGGQVVGHVAVDEVAERLGPGHRELARLAEVADGGAQLLDLGQPDP